MTATETNVGTGIKLDASFFILMWVLFFFKPTVVVDGQATKVGWGDSFVPTTAGTHEVEVFFRYVFLNAGKSSTTVTVPDGGTASLKYRAPFMFIFLPGKLTVG